MATPTSNLPNAPEPSSTELEDDDRAAPELVDETQDDGDDDGLPDHSAFLPRMSKSCLLVS
jgi:hypothetical protein